MHLLFAAHNRTVKHVNLIRYYRLAHFSLSFVSIFFPREFECRQYCHHMEVVAKQRITNLLTSSCIKWRSICVFTRARELKWSYVVSFGHQFRHVCHRLHNEKSSSIDWMRSVWNSEQSLLSFFESRAIPRIHILFDFVVDESQFEMRLLVSTDCDCGVQSIEAALVSHERKVKFHWRTASERSGNKPNHIERFRIES